MIKESHWNLQRQIREVKWYLLQRWMAKQSYVCIIQTWKTGESANITSFRSRAIYLSTERHQQFLSVTRRVIIIVCLKLGIRQQERMLSILQTYTGFYESRFRSKRRPPFQKGAGLYIGCRDIVACNRILRRNRCFLRNRQPNFPSL